MLVTKIQFLRRKSGFCIAGHMFVHRIELFENMYLTLWIEACEVHVLHLSVLKLLEEMYLISLDWASWLHVPQLTVFISSWLNKLYNILLKLLDYMNFTSMYWTFLSTFTLCQYNQASWVHTPDFNVLNLEYMYFTSMYWTFSRTFT